MAKVYKLKKVEYHSLNKYYGMEISEDQLRHIFEQANVPEGEHDELLDALADPEHYRNAEVWDILREDDYFNDGWDWEDDDLWTDRKGGYDIEESVEEVINDDYDSDQELLN